jgi:hypothetical protein
MGETRKILAQLIPVADTLTDMYVVPSSTQAVISTITACNQGGDGSSFRISIANSGSADNSKQYIYYDVYIDPHDSFASTIGITLNASDVVRCYSDNGLISFGLFGVEIS